jgi:heme/copper-type cytochrome/quinol oxidase subunit 4
MGSLKDALAVIVGLAALIYAIYNFYYFVKLENASHYMWWAIGCAVVSFVCGLIYFLGHVNKEEEIHITQ